jgi:enoyl-CoA hydratase/carnithine racemase
VGGGYEFTTACDVRIAAENARFGVPIARLGLPIGFREMRRLLRLIGPAKTMELLLTADLLPAPEAHRLGLVNHVVPLADVEAFTYAMAGRIAALAPVVHRVHKEIVQIVFDDPSLSGLTPAQRALAVLPFDTEDFQEGWRAFLEKRPPAFHGR